MAAELFETVVRVKDPVTGKDVFFNSKAEAMDFLRRPEILKALNKVTGGREDLSTWIVDNQESLEDVFGTGTITRVTKSERNQLKKALDAIKAADNPAFKFVQENADAILEVFKWPTKQRLNDEEKAAEIKRLLVTMTEGREDLADWLIANKDAIMASFDAGKIKREVNPKASAALEEYRAKMKQKKEDEAAAKEAELSLEDYLKQEGRWEAYCESWGLNLDGTEKPKEEKK